MKASMTELIKVVVFMKDSGRITSVGTTCFPELLDTPEQGVLTHITADIENDYVHQGEIHHKGDRPSKAHIFDYLTKTWVDPRTLEEHKTAQWTLIKVARDEAEFGGFTWDGSIFDSDQVSQARIQGAVLLATGNPNFVVDWTLADNTVRSLTADDLIVLSLTLGEHVSLQHSRARSARALLDQATSISEVQSIRF